MLRGSSVFTGICRLPGSVLNLLCRHAAAARARLILNIHTPAWKNLLLFGQATERGAMTYEERLEAAERRRLEGNEAFRAGEDADALGKYAMGLSYTNEDFLLQACPSTCSVVGQDMD